MPIDIYHITHIKNLPSILLAGGIIAKSKQEQKEINYIDIAHKNIQDRRAGIRVSCSAGGTLHDYVPFYFAPRSPMLYSISTGNVEGYQEGQNPVIYLVVEAESVALKIFFLFTNGHAIMTYSDFFDDLDRLYEVIDWELMESKYWFDTEDYPNRKCRRQVEFLVYECCPWRLIREIGVINGRYQEQVIQILGNVDHQPPVKVYSNWYY